MKKNIIIGILLVNILLIPTVAFAKSIDMPWTNVIYQISLGGEDDDSVSYFRHEGNICYIATGSPHGYGGRTNSISCVRDE